jgi:hypothetical protein
LNKYIYYCHILYIKQTLITACPEMCNNRYNIPALRRVFLKLLGTDTNICQHSCWTFYLAVLHKINNIMPVYCVLTHEEATQSYDVPADFPFCATCIAVEFHRVRDGLDIATIITSTPDDVRERVYALSRDPYNVRNTITNLY